MKQKQSNGSTRVKGSGLSSRTTGARKSSSTSRTWKRKDFAVCERYEIRFFFLNRLKGKKGGRFFSLYYLFERSTWKTGRRLFPHSLSRSLSISNYYSPRERRGKDRRKPPRRVVLLFAAVAFFFFFISVKTRNWHTLALIKRIQL